MTTTTQLLLLALALFAICGVQGVAIVKLVRALRENREENLRSLARELAPYIGGQISGNLEAQAEHAIQNILEERHKKERVAESTRGPNPYPLHQAAGTSLDLARQDICKSTGFTPRERRILAAQDRERVRSVLKGTAHKGFYVFEDLMTDHSGAIDIITVGPHGLTVLMLRADEGEVRVAEHSGELMVDWAPMEEDLYKALADQRDEVMEQVAPPLGCYWFICFTRAAISANAEANMPKNTRTIWTLPKHYEPDKAEPPIYDAATVDEVARRIQEVYDRPPYVTPSRVYPERDS